MTISLADHIRRFASLSPGDEALLLSSIQTEAVAKREYVFRAGEPGRCLAYVETGLLRLCSDTLKERTHQFALEGWWIADWEAFESGRPSGFSLQAIEDSRVVVLPHERYEPLLTAVPSLERYFRRVFQRAFGAAQRRLYLTETSSGEDMYHAFRRLYPDFVQRVPQYMLASFLGFTPEFLSKIRARS